MEHIAFVTFKYYTTLNAQFLFSTNSTSFTGTNSIIIDKSKLTSQYSEPQFIKYTLKSLVY